MEVVHYPNLRTVIMVEKAIKNAEENITREELKKLLPRQVMHQTLNVILKYLEESGKIYDGRKGIIWVEPSPKLQKIVAESRELWKSG